MNETELEAMAQDLSAKHGWPIGEVRDGLCVVLAKMALSFGLPVEKVNTYLAPHGLAVQQ